MGSQRWAYFLGEAKAILQVYRFAPLQARTDEGIVKYLNARVLYKHVNLDKRMLHVVLTVKYQSQ